MTRKMFATAALLFALSSTAFADTWKGFVSDNMCSRKHKADSKEDIECAKSCLKNGESAVFVTEGKIYKIDNPDAIKDHIGTTITISGKLTGDTIHIDKVGS